MYFPAKPWAVTAHPRPSAANTEGRDGARESSGRAGSEQRGLSSAVAFPTRASQRRRDPSSSCFTLPLLLQNRAPLPGWNHGATRGHHSGTASTAPGAIPMAAGGTAHPHGDIPTRVRVRGHTWWPWPAQAQGRLWSSCVQPWCSSTPERSGDPTTHRVPLPGTPPAMQGQRPSAGPKEPPGPAPPRSHLCPFPRRSPQGWTDRFQPVCNIHISEKLERGKAIIRV